MHSQALHLLLYEVFTLSDIFHAACQSDHLLASDVVALILGLMAFVWLYVDLVAELFPNLLDKEVLTFSFRLGQGSMEHVEWGYYSQFFGLGEALSGKCLEGVFGLLL